MGRMRAALTGTKRSDGRWQIVVTQTTVEGNKVRKTLYGATQREVQTKAREFLHGTGRTAHEAHDVSDLIGQYKLDRWPHLEKGTIRQHSPAYKWIEKGFGKTELRKIDPPSISRWMKGLSQQPTISGRTVQAYRNVLSTLFAYAVEIGWRNDNPAKGLALPAGVSAKPKPRPRLTPAGYRTLLEKEQDAVLRDLWEFLGETGMRPSEALRLTKADLFYSMDLYWARGGMKTEAGKGREVPIPDKLAHRLLEREKWLFPSPKGERPLNYRHVLDLWNERAKDAGLEDGTNPYQLRKLAISRWFANGLPDDVITALAGHTDIQMARSVYNRVGRERLMESAFSAQYVGGMSSEGKGDAPLGLD